MNKIMFVGLAFLAIASYVLCDTVYTKDGKSYNGKVTKAPGKVIIETEDGKVEVKEDNVLHISSLSDLSSHTDSGSGTPASSSAPGTSVEPGPSAATGQASTPAPVIKSSRFFQSVLPKNIEQPESAVFLMMRRIQSAGDTAMPADAEAEYNGWRAAAHDKRRRQGDGWMSQEIIIKMKKTHQAAIADAAANFKKIKKNITTTNPAEIKQTEEDNKRFKAVGLAKLRQAADAWPDRDLRLFLIGDAEMLNSNYTYAERYFQQARVGMPMIAGFWQGQAIAALELTERQLDAVTYLIEAIRLCPSSSELFKELNEAMSKVQGTKLNHPSYLAAQEFIQKFRSPSSGGRISSGSGGTGLAPSGSSSSSVRVRYTLPGKELTAKDNELVSLPYDRLYIQQAVGVPISATELLVDASALKDAFAVYVRIDPKTVIAADGKVAGPTVKKVGTDFEALKFSSCQFEPLKTGKEAQMAAGDEVAVYSADLYPEMGDGKIRQGKGTVAQASATGVDGVDAKILPGECSSAIVTADGKLAGFLAGKVLPEQPGGGPDKFISVAKLTNVQAKQPSKTPANPAASAPAAEPTAAPGQAFILYIIKSETFTD